MAVVPRGVIFGMLFYLTFAVAGTLWISMKYLNERECDCGQYFGKTKLSSSIDSAHEHDFPHLEESNTRFSEKRKRMEENTVSVQSTVKGKLRLLIVVVLKSYMYGACRFSSRLNLILFV